MTATARCRLLSPAEKTRDVLCTISEFFDQEQLLSSFQAEGGEGKKGEVEGDKSPEWLSQKLGSTANAAVNS